MPRLIADGEVKFSFVETIADLDAPTVVEVDAGTDVTEWFRSLDTPLDGNAVDAPNLSTAFRVTVAGKFGGNVSGEAYRDDTSDDAWALFPRNTTGFFVIRRFGGSDVAYAVADEVEVWPIRVITRSPATLDDEAVQMFTVDCAVLDEPVMDAVLA